MVAQLSLSNAIQLLWFIVKLLSHSISITTTITYPSENWMIVCHLHLNNINDRHERMAAHSSIFLSSPLPTPRVTKLSSNSQPPKHQPSIISSATYTIGMKAEMKSRSLLLISDSRWKSNSVFVTLHKEIVDAKRWNAFDPEITDDSTIAISGNYTYIVMDSE